MAVVYSRANMQMARKNERIIIGLKSELLDEIIRVAEKNDIDKVILFGSRARGDNKERSDIDIAFWGENANEFILDLDEETNTLLKFDIVDLNRPVQEELLESIRKEGIVIYEKV